MINHTIEKEKMQWKKRYHRNIVQSASNGKMLHLNTGIRALKVTGFMDFVKYADSKRRLIHRREECQLIRSVLNAVKMILLSFIDMLMAAYSTNVKSATTREHQNKTRKI